MKINRSSNKWQKWEIVMEVSTYEPRSPGTFGAQLVFRIEKLIVLAGTEDEANKKALLRVAGFETRVIGSKKKKSG